MKIIKTLLAAGLAANLALLLGGCAKGVEDTAVAPEEEVQPTYKVGFSTNGLAGAGLVAQINGANDLIVDGEGTYTFKIELNEGDFFELSIKQQPSGPNQTCEFNKLSGEIDGSINLELVLNCINIAYSVGGKINIEPNLLSQLIVAVNGNPTTLTIDGSGNFQFSEQFADALNLQLSFNQFPDLQTCTINGKDTHTLKVSGANISDLTIDCLYTSPLIKIQAMNFNISKTTTFTTPSVYDFITDLQDGGNPNIVQWNSRVPASSGKVVYNGNGTFDYVPDKFISSGQDSFSFKVSNNSGTQAEGLITLSIAKGWGIKNDFSTTVDARINRTLNLGDNYIIEYRDGNATKTHKLDKLNHRWLDAKPITSGAISLVGSVTQTIRYFQVTSSSTESTLFFRQYDPLSDTLTDLTELERIAVPNLNTHKVKTDNQGNIFLTLVRGYTDTNNFYYNEYWGKYFDATNQTWLPATRMFDSTRGTVQQNDIYLVGGKPVNFVRFPNGAIPVVFEYDQANNVMTEKPLSTEVLSATATGKIGWYTITQNESEDVALLWYQTVTDTTLGQDFRHVKTNIYSAITGSLQGEKTLHKLPISQVPTLKLSTLYKLDFLFMWRPYVSISTDPNYGQASVFAQAFNAETQSYDASYQTVVTNHQGSYLNVTPTPKVDNNGNVIFPYWIKDANNLYTHLFKALPYRGAWSAEQQINTVASSNSQISSDFDSTGNYFVLFDQSNANSGFYSARKYDFTTNSNSSIIPADNNNTAKNRPGIIRINNRMFFYWSKQNPSAQYDVCLREVSIGVGFSESDLSAEDCVNLSYPANGVTQISLFEDPAQNLLLFVSSPNIYFARKSADTWSNPEILFTPTSNGNFDRYFNSLYVHQYGTADAMSLTVQHQHEYSDAGGNFIVEQSLFNFLYN